MLTMLTFGFSVSTPKPGHENLSPVEHLVFLTRIINAQERLVDLCHSENQAFSRISIELTLYKSPARPCICKQSGSGHERSHKQRDDSHGWGTALVTPSQRKL